MAISRDTGVVLAAAGSGTRFGGPKHWLELDGRPIIWRTAGLFRELPAVAEIAVVVPEDDRRRVLEALTSGWPAEVGLRVVAGGPRRQDSVRRGIESLSEATEYVLVHDAARPLVSRDEVLAVLSAVRKTGAAVLGHPSTDSVKEADGGCVARDLPREKIWLVQTPQGARRDLLLSALAEADRAGFTGTDETSFLVRCSHRVALVEGSRDNIKITYPRDLELARFILRSRARP